jgi:hypothetical protein
MPLKLDFCRDPGKRFAIPEMEGKRAAFARKMHVFPLYLATE